MKPLVSIIVPVYNRPALVREAVASALAQTYRSIEIIIVDDGSTDDTPEVVDELAAEFPEQIRVIHQTNGGVGAARETGRQAMNGAFVEHLDSDDLLLPRKLELQVDALQRDPGASIAYSRGIYRDRWNHRVTCDWKPLLSGETSIFPHFLRARMWETAAPLYRREIVDAAGPWTSLRMEEDWEYDCRIGATNPRLTFVAEELYEHRAHAPDRLSSVTNRATLHDRAVAHGLIAGHALRAGVAITSPQFRHFARGLFLLGRQCGAAGLMEESRELIRLARTIDDQWDLRLYQRVAAVVGSRPAARLAAIGDRFR